MKIIFLSAIFHHSVQVHFNTFEKKQVEMRNIRDFVTTLDPVPVLGHCFHSYSQLWLWPYGYAYNAYPENKAEIQQLAIDASDALFQVHGTVFDPINSADLCEQNI